MGISSFSSNAASRAPSVSQLESPFLAHALGAGVRGSGVQGFRGVRAKGFFLTIQLVACNVCMCGQRGIWILVPVVQVWATCNTRLWCIILYEHCSLHTGWVLPWGPLGRQERFLTSSHLVFSRSLIPSSGLLRATSGAWLAFDTLNPSNFVSINATKGMFWDLGPGLG